MLPSYVFMAPFAQSSQNKYTAAHGVAQKEPNICFYNTMKNAQVLITGYSRNSSNIPNCIRDVILFYFRLLYGGIIVKFGDNLCPKQVYQLACAAETAHLDRDCYDFMAHLTRQRCAESAAHPWTAVSSVRYSELRMLQKARENITSTTKKSLQRLRGASDKHMQNLYRYTLKMEFKAFCEEHIALITSSALPLCSDKLNYEPIFCYKELADTHGILARIDGTDSAHKNQAMAHYQKAMNMATANMSEISVLRLNVALNFSVFHAETLKDFKTARKMASRAFEPAIEKLDTCYPEKEMMLALGELRDHIALWTNM